MYGRLQVRKDNALPVQVFSFLAVQDSAVAIDQAWRRTPFRQARPGDPVPVRSGLPSHRGTAEGVKFSNLKPVRRVRRQASSVGLGQGRHFKGLPCLQAEVQHPRGFVFCSRRLPHGLLRKNRRFASTISFGSFISTVTFSCLVTEVRERDLQKYSPGAQGAIRSRLPSIIKPGADGRRAIQYCPPSAIG